MMNEEYSRELGGCLLTMLICAFAMVACGIIGIIYLFT